MVVEAIGSGVDAMLRGDGARGTYCEYMYGSI